MKYFIGSRQYDGYTPTTVEKAIEYLQKQDVLGVDIETTKNLDYAHVHSPVYEFGLDPYISNIAMLQIGTLEHRFIVDAREVDLRPFIPIFESEEIVKVGMNLKFEGKFFLHHLRCRLVNVWDVMIAEKVLYNGDIRSFSLQALMEKYLFKKSIKSYNLFEIEDNPAIERQAKNIFERNLLAGIATTEESSYDQAVEDYVNTVFIDKGIRKGFVYLGDKPFTKKMLDYGDDDITAPLKIYEIQKKGRYVGNQLYRPTRGFELENAITQVMAEIELTGVPFNPDLWLETYEEQQKIFYRRLDMLNNYVIVNFPKYRGPSDLFTSLSSCAVEWSSPKQVIELFKHMGHCPMEKSKTTGKRSYTVGAKALINTLPNTHKEKFFKNQNVDKIETFEDFTLMYLLFKKSEQLITTFGKDWLKYQHPITKRVHSGFNQYMISSRFSSNSPNLQQIPGMEAYRRAFRGQLIDADYSAQEVRVAAEVHDVDNMIKFFVEGDEIFGDDFHSWTATKVFRIIYNDPELIVKKETHEEERTKAKSTTFKLQYGGSEFSIMLEFNISEDEAKKFLNSYFEAFPGLQESMEEKKKEAVQTGWIRLDDYTDKRYFFPHYNAMISSREQAYELLGDHYKSLNKVQKQKYKEKLKATTNYSDLWKQYYILEGKLHRRALNLPIQGASATMIKYALLKLYNYRWEHGIQNDFKILLPVHDEILAEYATPENKEKYSKLLEDAMQEAGTYICSRIPMIAKAAITEFWKH